MTILGFSVWKLLACLGLTVLAYYAGWNHRGEHERYHRLQAARDLAAYDEAHKRK